MAAAAVSSSSSCEARACGLRLLWPRLLLFGDSITEPRGEAMATPPQQILPRKPQGRVTFRNNLKFSFQENGWGALLAHRLARKCDILNRGLSGYNTRWAKIVLPRLIQKDSTAKNTIAVTVFFGANDSALKDVNPKQHVPLEEYAANLKSMVQYLKSVDIAEDKIILVTPPPLHEAAWEKECVAKGEKLNRLNSTTGEYAKTCVKVAEDCGTGVIDLWTLMQKNNKDFGCYLSDGLHLSGEGNNFLANQLWSLLEQRISTLPVLLPYWRDVDHLHPEASLSESPHD